MALEDDYLNHSEIVSRHPPVAEALVPFIGGQNGRTELGLLCKDVALAREIFLKAFIEKMTWGKSLVESWQTKQHGYDWGRHRGGVSRRGLHSDEYVSSLFEGADDQLLAEGRLMRELVCGECTWMHSGALDLRDHAYPAISLPGKRAYIMVITGPAQEGLTGEVLTNWTRHLALRQSPKNGQDNGVIIPLHPDQTA